MHCSSWQATEPSKETIVSEIHSHLIAPLQRHCPDDPLTILPSYYPLKLRRQCSSIFIDGLLLRKNDPTSAVGTRLVNIIVQKSNVIHGTCFPVRTTTVVVVGKDGHATFVEKTMRRPIQLGKYEWDTQRFDFELN